MICSVTVSHGCVLKTQCVALKLFKDFFHVFRKVAGSISVMKQSFKIIAIDGGAGSGKSTTASILSQRLNLLHVDTGLHYRAVTQSLLNKLGEVKNFESYLNKNKISFDTILSAKKSLIVVDGQTYSLSELRSKRINESVSNCASIPSVRNALLDYQRSLVSYAKQNNFLGVVMEGRDIGSVVLPDADLKDILGCRRRNTSR